MNRDPLAAYRARLENLTQAADSIRTAIPESRRPPEPAEWRERRLAMRRMLPVDVLGSEMSDSFARHHAGRQLLRCACGSYGFAAWTDTTIQASGLQCLVCGAIPPGALR